MHLAGGKWSREMERPTTNQSHWWTDRQKKKKKKETNQPRYRGEKGWGWGGRMANAFTRPDRGVNTTSPLPELHHIRPHRGAWGSRTGRGRMWEVGWGGLWTLTWSYTCQHGQRVMGERHACRPRMAGQSAEIEFPRLLKRTRRRESW